MKGISFILVASFLFLTSSCNTSNHADELALDKNIKQVIFFSSEDDYEQEASYYDAIIELKEQYPKAIDNMMIIPASNAKKYDDFLHVEHCPAIFVVYGNQIIAKVNGKVTKDEIIEPLSKVLDPK